MDFKIFPLFKRNDDHSKTNLIDEALRNPLILQKIFHFCEPTELKNARLVSRLWLQESLTCWRNRAHLQVSAVPIYNTSISFDDLNAQFADPEDLLQLQVKPFRKYKLLDTKLKNRPGTGHLANFWTTTGVLMNMKQLNLADSHLILLNQGDFVRLLPNLECLTVSTTHVTFPFLRWNEYSPVHHHELRSLVITKQVWPRMRWENILSTFTHLKELIVENIVEGSSDQDAPGIYDYYGLFSLIRALMIRSDEASTLEVVKLEIPPAENKDSLEEILSKNAPTLQILKLFRVPSSHVSLANFPFGINLNSLTELYLWGHIAENLLFLRFTPNLKILDINTTCANRHLSRPHGNKCHSEMIKLVDSQKRIEYSRIRQRCVIRETMKVLEQADDTTFVFENLRVFEMDYSFSKDAFISLSRWMPKLTRICVIFNDETLPIVDELWPRIEDLQLYCGCRVTDEAIISLKKLQYLRKFTLESNNCMNTIRLTDKSVYQGFLKMPSLKEVNMMVISEEISKSAVAKLKERIDKVKIRTAGEYNRNGNFYHRCCKLSTEEYLNNVNRDSEKKLRSRPLRRICTVFSSRFWKAPSS